MNDFWTNLTRYPRFLISSGIGLVLVLLTPLRTLWNRPRWRLLVPLGLLLLSSLVGMIVTQMLGV